MKKIFVFSFLAFLFAIGISIRYPSSVRAQTSMGSDDFKKDSREYDPGDYTPASKNVKCHISMKVVKPPFGVNLKIQNLSKFPIKIMDEDFPASGRMQKDIFVVRCNGKKARYFGRLAKRRAKDVVYYVVKPGKTMEASTDLLPLYEIKPAGKYSVIYEAVYDYGKDKVEFLKSNIIYFTIK